MKTKISIAITFLLIAGIFTFGNVFAQPPIKVYLEQTKLKFKAELFTQNNTVMAPVRDLAEALGAQVDWDNKSKTVWVKQNKMSIELTVGKDIAYIHRQDDFTGIPEKCQMTAPVTTVKKATYVPLRFIAERLGYEVSWSNKDRTVVIKKIITEAPVNRPLSFTVIGFDDIKSNQRLVTWYNANYQNKGIYHISEGKTVYILASAGIKPTGGYSININKIELAANQKAVVQAEVTSPAPDAMVTQALTYPNVLVKIEGCDITAIEGTINEKQAGSTDETSGKIFGDTVTKFLPGAVKSMELRNLDGVKIKDLKAEEIKAVIEALNVSKISDSPYIEMLAGNNIYAVMSDGTTISFTSYGSKTNYIAVVKAGTKTTSYHLVGAYIAELLLAK